MNNVTYYICISGHNKLTLWSVKHGCILYYFINVYYDLGPSFILPYFLLSLSCCHAKVELLFGLQTMVCAHAGLFMLLNICASHENEFNKRPTQSATLMKFYLPTHYKLK